MKKTAAPAFKAKIVIIGVNPYVLIPQKILKIIFVHKSVVDSFIEKFNAQVKKLKPGMPWDSGVGLTAEHAESAEPSWDSAISASSAVICETHFAA